MTNKVLLLVLEFIVSVVLGFLIPKALQKEEVLDAVADTETVEVVPAEELLSVLEVTDPVYDEASKKYSFIVTASSNARLFYLADSSRQPISGSAQQSGEFSVSPVSDGIYYVYVVDAAGHESEYVEVNGCKPADKSLPEKSRVRREEFQRLLMDKSPNAATSALKGRIASTVRYQFANLSEDDLGMEPRHYTGIITNLQIGHWKSVEVTSVGYNTAGLLNQAKITVTY